MIKAANEGGYTGKFFAHYTRVTGTPAALGQTRAGKVFQVFYAHYNTGAEMARIMSDFKARFNDDLYTGSAIRQFEFLGNAMAKAKSTDPVKVAFAIEGMKIDSAFGGETQMRKTDHQLQQTLYITVWRKTDSKHPYAAENTGMTLVPVATYQPCVASTRTSCQMVRPSGGCRAAVGRLIPRRILRLALAPDWQRPT